MNVIKRKKYFVGVFVLGFLLLASRLWGQDMNITSSSPEMALLMRSVNNPVNLNTGIVNVQVPLFSIQEGGLTLPIGINYQTTGIKLHDIATWVGLGWNLSAGGRISRIVKKRPEKLVFVKVLLPMEQLHQNYHLGQIVLMIRERVVISIRNRIYFFMK